MGSHAASASSSRAAALPKSPARSELPHVSLAGHHHQPRAPRKPRAHACLSHVSSRVRHVSHVRMHA
eukprot:3454812-Prymnesium_polylepis.1